jgi:hypothetical protein
MSDNQPSSTSSEKVSYNSKAVLLGLFALVGFVILVYTIAINLFSPGNAGRLNTIFVAAISGTLALGGTLITQLWGKNNNVAANSPTIYRTTPPDTEIGISVNDPITATFNKMIDESTINANTFTLKDEKTKSNVDGTVKLEGGNAIFKPSKPLAHSTKYVATITKDVKDLTGNSLAVEKIWSFTTEPSPQEVKESEK